MQKEVIEIQLQSSVRREILREAGGKNVRLKIIEAYGNLWNR